MKLFIIVYIFGRIAASVGPLPYDMQVCQTKALPMLAKIQSDGWAESIKNGTAAKLKPLDGRIFRGPRDTVNRCEWRAKRPKAGRWL